MFLFSITHRKSISQTNIESPCIVPFSSLKNLVVLPPLIMQETWFLSKNFTHLTNLLPNPHLSNVEIINAWSIESNAFWISIVANDLSNFNISLISDKSEISLPPSLIYRPST